MRIIIDIPASHRACVRKALEALDAKLEISDPDPDLPDGWADCLLTWAPSEALLKQLSPTGFIQAYGAGVDRILTNPGLRPGTQISRLVDSRMSAGMTQHIVLSILRWVRNDATYGSQQARRIWNRLPNPNLAEWPVGILGMGALGSHLASAIEVIGLPVQGWRRRDGATGDFSAFLRSTRILVCLLPLTPETRGLLDHRAFATMPAGSYVVNCGRGPVIVEDDLVAALRQGHIAGAALDVFETEPLPPDHPFWTTPGVSVTPHIATFPVAKAVAEQTIANLRRSDLGVPLANVADPTAGY